MQNVVDLTGPTDAEETLLTIPPIHIVHGIKTWRNKSSFTHLMAEELQRNSLSVEEEYYGYVNALSARWRNYGIAEEMFDSIPDGAIFMGHSNAAVLGWMLDQMGKQFSGVVLIQPALDRDKIFHRSKWVDVYYNRKDCAVNISRILLLHPWGAQGKFGPDVAAAHGGYTAFDTMNTPGLPSAAGHIWYKDPFLRRVWGKHVAGRIFEMEGRYG